MDPFKVSSSADEFCKGLHEIGHCDTGSFYNRETPFDIRQKHENIADKRAIELCISADELHAAQANGYTEIWELAEHFGDGRFYAESHLLVYAREPCDRVVYLIAYFLPPCYFSHYKVSWNVYRNTVQIDVEKKEDIEHDEPI